MIAFIILCCVGALIIEMRERFLMDKVMDRRVADLMLRRDNVHRFVSFKRI
jgi:hypothetical protein